MTRVESGLICLTGQLLHTLTDENFPPFIYEMVVMPDEVPDRSFLAIVGYHGGIKTFQLRYLFTG